MNFQTLRIKRHSLFFTVIAVLFAVALSDMLIVDHLIIPYLNKMNVAPPTLQEKVWGATDVWWIIFWHYWIAFSAVVIGIYAIISMLFHSIRPLVAMVVLFGFGAEDLLYYWAGFRAIDQALPWLDVLPSWKFVMWITGAEHTTWWMILFGGIFSMIISYFICTYKYRNHTT